MVKYNIISTGSDGNATILEDFVLIDCGVPYKALEPYVTKLKLVLLTHIHSDHFQKRTIKRLAEERPTLRFGCCRWLAPPLLAAGVPERQIDVLEPRTMAAFRGNAPRRFVSWALIMRRRPKRASRLQLMIGGSMQRRGRPPMKLHPLWKSA